jgi:D-psicose/D-tagatose/L-ribulose 3-epimerase
VKHQTRRNFLATTVGAAAASLSARCVRAITQPPASCPDFRLRFGVTQSGTFDLLAGTDTLARWGFDYIEPTVTKIMSLSNDDFESTRATLAAAPIHVESMNVLLPGDMKVVGPAVDHATLDPYIQKALARANALGTKIVVFGSGTSRRVPDNFSHEQAWSQLQEFLRMMGNIIDRQNYGFVIGIEALRKQESNIVNTTAEAYQLSLDANHPKVRIICDFYHLASEHEDPRVLLKVKDRLVHLHFANECNNRAFPLDPGECPEYAPFFTNLRAINYQGRLSIEAGTHDFESDAPKGLATLRQLYANACAT